VGKLLKVCKTFYMLRGRSQTQKALLVAEQGFCKERKTRPWGGAARPS
jgi:hypothetical protein